LPLSVIELLHKGTKNHQIVQLYTLVYTHIVNEQKEKAANTLHIENLDL